MPVKNNNKINFIEMQNDEHVNRKLNENLIEKYLKFKYLLLIVK